MTTTISTLIDRTRVLLPLRSSTKKDVLDEMIAHLAAATGREDLSGRIREGVWAREREISTGIGRGIAIPHAELDEPIEAAAVLGISPSGVDFEALDSAPVHIVFLLVCSTRSQPDRLAILSRLSSLFGDASVRKALRRATSAEDVVQIIREREGGGEG
jgi:mannitol/fructose-specific phosphotransferase system IIA component (Ntr-type)